LYRYRQLQTRLETLVGYFNTHNKTNDPIFAISEVASTHLDCKSHRRIFAASKPSNNAIHNYLGEDVQGGRVIGGPNVQAIQIPAGRGAPINPYESRRITNLTCKEKSADASMANRTHRYLSVTEDICDVLFEDILA
jgi:hypothetical protein